MTDIRVRVPLNGKTISLDDLAQLDAKLGGYGLCGGSDEIVVPEHSPVTAAALADALAAHTPVHVPLDPYGRLLTELSVHGVIPVAEAANLREDLTVEKLQNEFLGWLAAAGL